MNDNYPASILENSIKCRNFLLGKVCSEEVEVMRDEFAFSAFSMVSMGLFNRVGPWIIRLH